jgi:hypothetical protein
VTMATGTLVKGSLSREPNGTGHSTYLTSFVPAAGARNLFVDPGGHLWDEFGTTPPGAFSVAPVVPANSLSFLTLVSGDLGSQATAQLVPEPSPIGLLAAATLALGFVTRRRSQQA